MSPGQKAVAAGVLAAVPILGIALYRKVGNLLDQAQVVEASLQAEARRQVELSAETTVKEYLADTYGLTEERITRIGRLAEAVPSGLFG